MNYKLISKILGIIVILGGIIVMVGWFAGIPILTSILPFWVTMKFSTAFSFFLSGLILYFINLHLKKKGEFSDIVIPLSSFIVFLLMVILLISTFIGVRTGIEDLFVEEATGAVKTTTPGRPSIGTMASFVLMSLTGFLAMLNIQNINKIILGIGKMVTTLGSIAILGYIINMPFLYYHIEGWSTAMAFHTAIFFVLLGVGLIFSGKEDINRRKKTLKNLTIKK